MRNSEVRIGKCEFIAESAKFVEKKFYSAFSKAIAVKFHFAIRNYQFAIL